MSNIVPFEKQQVPAHVLAAFGDIEGNIPERVTIPQLSFRGKVWRIVMGGEETPLMRKDPETGDSVPVSTVPVVILAMNPQRSRAYYEGSFAEGEKKAPKCRSKDGKVPDADVKEPQARTCAECKMAAKGSKVQDGKEMVACSTFKDVVVVPAGKLDFHPLRLRLAQTSLWDKDNAENEAQGWYAYDQWLDFIRARGVKHTAAVAAKLKFDHRVAHPKVLVKVDRWLEPDEIAKVAAAIKKPEVQAALNMTENVQNHVHEDVAAHAEVAPAPTKSVPEEEKAAAPAAERRGPGRPRKTAPPAEQSLAAAASAVVEDEGDPFAEVVSQATPAKAAKVEVLPPEKKPAAKPAAEVDNGLAEVLGNWDD